MIRLTILYITLSSLAVVCILRLFQLDKNPPGFFVDESSIAYNAFSIAKTGKDEHGVTLPVFFKAFGEYKSPLYIYSQVPLLTIFKTTVTISRLVSALWGLLSLGALFVLSKKISQDSLVSLITTLVLATSSVHFILSRVVFEIIVYPFLVLLSLYFLERYSSSFKSKYFYLFIFFQAVSFYAYTSAKVFSLFFSFAAILLFFKRLKLINSIKAILLIIIILLPALIWETYHPGSLSARYQTVSIFSYESGLNAYQHIVSNYLKHFSVNFLFNSGDGYLRHSAAFHSVFFVTLIPILLIGGFSLTKHLYKPINKFYLLALMSAPIPAAVTIQSPHILRSINLVIFSNVLIIIGLKVLAKRSLKLLLLFVIFFLVEATVFIKFVFTIYPQQAEVWFDADAYKALSSAATLPGPYYLSDKLYPGTYSTWLFIRSYSPKSYQQNQLEDTTFINPTQQILFKSGTYVFDSETCQNKLPTHFFDQAFKIDTHTHHCVYTYEVQPQ